MSYTCEGAGAASFRCIGAWVLLADDPCCHCPFVLEGVLIVEDVLVLAYPIPRRPVLCAPAHCTRAVCRAARHALQLGRVCQRLAKQWSRVGAASVGTCEHSK